MSDNTNAQPIRPDIAEKFTEAAELWLDNRRSEHCTLQVLYLLGDISEVESNSARQEAINMLMSGGFTYDESIGVFYDGYKA